MEFSSGTMEGIRKVEEGLEKEVERERRKKTLKQPRAHAWMGRSEMTRTRPLSQCDGVNDSHLHTARIVLSGARLSRLCESWCSRNLSQWSQDCRDCA